MVALASLISASGSGVDDGVAIGDRRTVCYFTRIQSEQQELRQDVWKSKENSQLITPLLAAPDFPAVQTRTAMR
jgi:hypothetical protein